MEDHLLRIFTKLKHGYHPSLDDLSRFWNETKSRPCSVCGTSGKSWTFKVDSLSESNTCLACEGTGYIYHLKVSDDCKQPTAK